MLNAATLIPALRAAGCTSDDITEVTRAVMNGRHDVKRLRDEFAMVAIQGMLTYPGDDRRGSAYDAPKHEVCDAAYEWADQMMDARERGANGGR